MTTSWEGFKVTGDVQHVAKAGAVPYPVLHLVKGVHSVHRTGEQTRLVILTEPIEEDDGQALLALLRSLPGIESVEPMEVTPFSQHESGKVKSEIIDMLGRCQTNSVPTEASAVQAARYRMADRVAQHLFGALKDLL